jgi:hypothetical protein
MAMPQHLYFKYTDAGRERLNLQPCPDAHAPYGYVCRETCIGCFCGRSDDVGPARNFMLQSAASSREGAALYATGDDTCAARFVDAVELWEADDSFVNVRGLSVFVWAVRRYFAHDAITLVSVHATLQDAVREYARERREVLADEWPARAYRRAEAPAAAFRMYRMHHAGRRFVRFSKLDATVGT